MSTKGHKSASTAALHEKLGSEKHDSTDESPVEEELLEHLSYPELQNKLTETEKKVSEYMDRMLRMQADTENMQRRVERDIQNAHKYALEKFAMELLPVIDSLERAVSSHQSDESGADSLLAGVSLTLKMFSSALEKFGVQQVNPEGEAFNPEFHQAVSTQEDPKAKSGTVITVLQKGYLLNGRLIRPALVIVAK